MSQNITYSTTLVAVECGECGIPFGLPQSYHREARREGWLFSCPNGHRVRYVETDNARLTAEVARLEGAVTAARADRDRARRNADRERRSSAAVRGHLTRIRKRLAAGVCPVAGCTRSGFEHDRMLAHLRDKHPKWCADHEDAIK